MDMMTGDVETVTPESMLAEAVDKMLDHSIHCLPVVQDDHIEGILTHTDILRLMMRLDAV